MKPRNLSPLQDIQFATRTTNPCIICHAERHGILQY